MKLKESDLICAPNRETLKMFGGNLLIDDFRKNLKTYKIIYPPLIPLIPYMEEIDYIDVDKEIQEKNKNNKKCINKNSLEYLFQKK